MAGTLHIDINIEHDAWLDAIAEVEALIQKTAQHTLETTGLAGYADSIEVSILLTDDASIRDLNLQYRDKDKPTNVLSFPQEEMAAGEYEEWEGESVLLGDVTFALETLQNEAEEQGKTVKHHFMHLLVHGLLHLQGYDHGTERDATEMEALEADILSDFSVPDPYAD